MKTWNDYKEHVQSVDPIITNDILDIENISSIISSTSDPFYSESNQAHLMNSLQQLHDGNCSAHELIEIYDE